jgi:RHS repeat-associated protein
LTGWQTAKEGVVSDEEGNKTRGWNSSGAVYYDEMGRTIEEGQTQFETMDYSLPLGDSEYPSTTDMVNPTLSDYDTMGRPVTVTLPYDEATLETEYSLGQVSLEGEDLISGSDENHQITIQTDPEGNVTEIYKNGRGHIAAIVKKDSSGDTLTEMSYEYDLLGELLATSDYLGNSVIFEYDLLGRTTYQYSPDAGEQTFSYSDEGLLESKKDSNLTESGDSISYEYDDHNRLITVDYPYSDDVSYEYGDDTDGYSLGRLKTVSNGTTTSSYEYGCLGEITQMSWTIDRMNDSDDDVTATFENQSDYLGRMEEITYPDGEVLTYSYDEGGQITGATGERLDTEFPYVEDIGYDEYGQRVYIKYNSENGTETTYTYDEESRRLTHLETVKDSKTYQSINYTFDTVGNITNMENNDTYNHSTEQTYSYDGLYQLTGVTGDYSLHESDNSTSFTSSYTQSFSYDKIGNMLTKVSSEDQSPNLGETDLDYDSSYSYYADSPHQVEIIGSMYYDYDANGNVIEARMGGHSEEDETDSASYTYYDNDVTMADEAFGWYDDDEDEEDDSAYCMDFSWDEENRLTKTEDTYYTTYYAYDHEGERAIKYSDLGETLYFDSMWVATDSNTDGSLRRTKNIYIGETRIASKMNFEDASTSYEEIHTYYYHTDHLGSSNVVTDYEGEVYEHLEYTPYGETWVHDQSEDDLGLVDYAFTSKGYDEETGLYYMSARYMNPVASRWASSDPEGWGLVNPNQESFYLISSINWYSYTENNPVKYNDPDGEMPTIVVGAIIGGVVGGVTGGLSAAAQGNTSFREIAGGAAGVALSGAVTGALIESGAGIAVVAAGSFAGGALGSVTENTISKGISKLDAKNVMKDAAVDGLIAAGSSVASVGVTKALGTVAANMELNAVTKALAHEINPSDLKNTYTASKAITTLGKEGINLGASFTTDVIQDQTGPDVQATVEVDAVSGAAP